MKPTLTVILALLLAPLGALHATDEQKQVGKPHAATASIVTDGQLADCAFSQRNRLLYGSGLGLSNLSDVIAS
jgi:hypothetical protein